MTEAAPARRAEDRAMRRLACGLGVGYCVMTAAVWSLVGWLVSALFS